MKEIIEKQEVTQSESRVKVYLTDGAVETLSVRCLVGIDIFLGAIHVSSKKRINKIMQQAVLTLDNGESVPLSSIFKFSQIETSPYKTYRYEIVTEKSFWFGNEIRFRTLDPIEEDK